MGTLVTELKLMDKIGVGDRSLCLLLSLGKLPQALAVHFFMWQGKDRQVVNSAFWSTDLHNMFPN